MAAIPDGVLKRLSKKIKKNILIYSFSFVLLVETLSLTILRDSIASPCNPYWYVLLTQLVLFILFTNLNYYRIELNICQRQVNIVKSLMYYYFIGGLSLIFKVSDSFYVESSKYLLLSFATIVLLQTIYKNKEK